MKQFLVINNQYDTFKAPFGNFINLLSESSL